MDATPSTAASDLVVCAYCDTVHRRRPLPPKASARCRRCGGALYRRPRLNLTVVAALALTALVVLVLANALPLMTLQVQGQFMSGTLWDAVLATDREGFGEVSVLVAMMAFFAPLLQLLLLLYVAVPLRRGRRPRHFVLAMHALRALRPWNLVEVFLLGALIATVKLGGLALVSPDAGLWAFAVLTVLLTVLSADDAESFWSVGQRCR